MSTAEDKKITMMSPVQRKLRAMRTAQDRVARARRAQELIRLMRADLGGDCPSLEAAIVTALDVTGDDGLWPDGEEIDA